MERCAAEQLTFKLFKTALIDIVTLNVGLACRSICKELNIVFESRRF